MVKAIHTPGKKNIAQMQSTQGKDKQNIQDFHEIPQKAIRDHMEMKVMCARARFLRENTSI